MSLGAALAAYLTRVWGEPVAIEALARIPGGASRETWRFDAVGGNTRRSLILRRDPGGSLIETERAVEYAALRTAHGRLPVPEPVALEAGVTELERPFFLMARVDGGQVPSPFAPDPYGVHAPALGRAFFGYLGDLAALPVEATPLAEVLPTPAPDECWRVALDHWAGVIEADEQHPQPIVRAAIRRLYAAPPPLPERIGIVHGDYRSGNFLHDGAGGILAILDWEMAHLGDPLEDLGWALDPLWEHGVGRAGGMLAREEALAIWSAHSGRPVDADGLRWWSLFAAVKAQAIWTSAAREWRDGGMVDPVLAISGWYPARAHDVILAEQLERWR